MATSLLSPVEAKIIEFINDRLESWKRLLQAQIACFQELADLERHANASYNKMSQSLAAALPSVEIKNSPLLETFTQSHAWLGPMQSYTVRCSSDAENLRKHIIETAIPQLELLLRDELRKRGKNITSILIETQTRLQKIHESMTRSIEIHEKGWNLRLRLGEGEGESAVEDSKLLFEAMSGTDTFISELQLGHNSAAFLDEKDHFCKNLSSQYELVKGLERDLAGGLAAILVEFMKIKKQQSSNKVELLVDCENISTSFDPLSEWNQALQRIRLDWDWKIEAPPLDGFMASVLTHIECSLSGDGRGTAGGTESNTIKTLKIVKSGYLMRPSSGIAFGRSWNVIFCLLTDSAFLHCYNPMTLVKTIKDKRTTMANNGNSDNCSPIIEGGPIRIPNSSMNLHKRGLAELNNMATRMWSYAPAKLIMDHRIDKNGLEEVLSTSAQSIPLLHPNTSIIPDTKEKNAFSITVPGEAGLFGKGEKRYQLKSFVEEDMVDWCIAIKELVGSGVARKSSSSLSQSRSTTPTVLKDDPFTTRSHDDPFTTRSHDNPFHSTASMMELGNLEHYHNSNDGDCEEDAQFRDRFSNLEIKRSSTTPITDIENPWDS